MHEGEDDDRDAADDPGDDRGGAGTWAAYSEPNSHPEPMMELSDAQTAPMNPTSRFRPTSDGLETTAPVEPVSVAMIDSSFLSILCPSGACRPALAGSCGRREALSNVQGENIVEMILPGEKC